MNKQLSTIRWKRVIGNSLTGVILILALLIVQDIWKKRDGWCIQFHPDGSEQKLYGRDCQK